MRGPFATLTLALLAIVPVSDSAGVGGTGEVAFTQTLAEVWGVASMRSNGADVRRLTLEPTSDAWPVKSPNGKLATFASRRDGQWEIYVMRADGTQVRRVTRHPAHDTAPDWSPDGRRIVFSRGVSGRSRLLVVNAAGGSARPLTRGSRGDDEPAWSPDGRRIAFSRKRAGNRYDIWVLELATGVERRLTRGPRDDWGPRWSPDGRDIAFTTGITTCDGYLSDIAVIRPDGTKRRRFTKLPALRNSYPTWSPDGAWIAFWSTRGEAGVWLIRRDGTTRRPLRPTQCCAGWEYHDLRWARDGTMTFSHEHTWESALIAVDGGGVRRMITSGSHEQERDVSWAADGRTFVFTAFLGTCCSDDIFLRRADGSERNLDTHPARDRQPDLSPAGDLIAFATERGPAANLVDIWLMGADGAAARPLVEHPDNDAQPDFSPDGRHLVFARFPVSEEETPPGDVFVSNLSGVTRRLTSHPANDKQPRWSPDGKTIVFTSTRDGRFQLYTMRADGTNQTRLLTSDADDREPSWSPDGSQIVFDRFTSDRVEVWTVAADGTDARRLTTVCASRVCRERAEAPSPSWRPRSGA